MFHRLHYYFYYCYYCCRRYFLDDFYNINSVSICSDILINIGVKNSILCCYFDTSKFIDVHRNVNYNANLQE